MKANKYDLIALGQFPRSWQDPNTGTTYPRLFLEQMSVSELEAIGWYEIVDNAPVQGSNDNLTKDSLVFNGSTIEQNYTVTAVLTLIDAQAIKYSEIWERAEVRITNTAKGTSSDPRHRDRIRDKSQARLMKKANGGSLTVEEQADEDWYDSYLDWADITRDEAQAACDAVEALNTPELVIAYDINAIVWTTFTP